ncbi:FHA domain-containing protein [Singulisphaera sp. Ch08]|uniref:FHA domain-containing protein n=1 Tax=Singulisphaera sp. Ch08 TaxID=3120278 RepID=A0AAU7CDN6_9BACT
MAQICPRCDATVGDDLTRCPSCGADLDPCRTIPPARPRQITPAKAPATARKVSPVERAEHSEEREPATPPPPRPIKKVKPRPVAPQPSAQAPSAPTPAPQPAKPGPQLAYTPSTSTGEMAYAAPAYAPPGGAAPAPPEARGGLRGWMIKMLGGAQPAPPQAQPQPQPMPGASPYYGYQQPGGAPPQPGPHPGMYPPGAAHQTPPIAPAQPLHPTPHPGWPEQHPAPGFGGPQHAQGGPGAPPPHTAPPSLLDPFGGDSEEMEAKTQFLGGVDLDKLKIPKFTFTLQILDHQGQWRDWGPIHANGLNVGRAKTSAEFPGLSSMAVRHMKLRYDRTTLVVEDLGSINGVYLRVIQPTELSDGMRFRVGNQTIEFHEAPPFEPASPLVGEDGEEYCSRDLEPLAYLDLIRPNGQPGLRFPITRQDATILGREGPNTHIALTSDNSVSGMHARVYRKDGKFILEDLKSRNGTFVHVLGSAKVSSGDVLLAGLVLFRVIDHIQ